MYYCKDCDMIFDKLIHFLKTDKYFQLCPHCRSENLILSKHLSESEKIRILRKEKLKRILNEDGIRK